MGARRVSPAEIIEMHRLYAIHGTYSAVAYELGRSPSTVAKYINLSSLPNNVRIAIDTISKK